MDLFKNTVRFKGTNLTYFYSIFKFYTVYTTRSYNYYNLVN